jgi:CheY-like chemotaxis protein
MAGGVLIVEDDEDIRTDLGAILRLKGFAVDEAANGRDALARMREAAAPPCVVLLDLMMPVMNGWELRAAMQADPRLAAVPVIVMSGAGREHAPIAADAVLLKPFELTRLLELVGRFCAPSTARPGE